MDLYLFGVAFAAYTIAMMLFFGYAITRREALAVVAKKFLLVAAGAHAFSLITRTLVAHQMPQHSWYVPWNNLFETLSFFALVITIVYFMIQRTHEVPILGAFVAPIVFLTMVAALKSPFGLQIPRLPSTLQSYWMAIHVPVMFTAYAAFANAFGIGIAYLLQEHQLKSRRPSHLMFRLPALDELDALIYRTILYAFPILSLGLVIGAFWAHSAWGRWWGWDPKETWALVTWLTYLLYLQLRISFGWRGRKTTYLSMLGFLIVIGTYIGVNYFSPLHGFLSTGVHQTE